MRVAISILLLSLFLFSCSPRYYSPNTINTPLLTQKGETNINVTGREALIEVQGAYAVANHIGILANGSFFIPKNEDNGDGGQGKFVEAGIGYFIPMSNNMVFDTYLLIGGGNVENHFPSSVTDHPGTTGKIEANLFRIGIQPGIGYKIKNFEAAFNPRISYLTYNSIEGNLIVQEDQVKYLNDNKSNFLVEPAITVRGGFEKIKAEVQLGYSFNVSNVDFKQDKLWLSFGLGFRFK